MYCARAQAGLTLLEVLIAVLVLAIGLLGIAGLQTSALTNNFVSYQYTQAAILAQSMLDRMRANRQGVVDGDYQLVAGSAPSAPATDCSSGGCTAALDQATWDMAVWYGQVTGATVSSKAPKLSPQDSSSKAAAAIPNSAASISCPATYAENEICTISVYWDANRTVDTSGGTNTTKYSCNPSDSNALRCFRLAFTP